MSSVASSTPGLTIDQLKELSGQPHQIAMELARVLLTMSDPVEETRAWAADILQELESIDQAKAKEIAHLCDHQAEFVVYWTVEMLGKASDMSDFEKPIAELLRSHSSVVVRQAAVKALQHLSSASKETLSALTLAAESADPRLKRLAQQALSELGG